MQIHTYFAESVSDAVAQIRETLGPNAVVLNVRRLPAEGLARLWQKPRIEVLAHVPELPTAPTLVTPPAPVLDEVQVSALAELRAEMHAMRACLPQPLPPAAPAVIDLKKAPATPAPLDPTTEATLPGSYRQGDWRLGALLEQSGLLPVHAARLVDELCAQHGEAAPIALAAEIALAQEALGARWKTAPPQSAGPHVFIGAPGAGKTTVLCKWLAQEVLVAGRRAAVWRLDSHVANTAESLSVFGEILGVPVERCAPANGERPEAEVLFIDLPGVNPTDPAAVAQLAQRLAALPDAQVHLVVNGAYETAHLLAQVRAFAALPVRDVIVTHLDEELRWGKVWNLVLGTNCPVAYLAAGQNIPGDFTPATPEKIFSRQFPVKPGQTAGRS